MDVAMKFSEGARTFCTFEKETYTFVANNTRLYEGFEGDYTIVVTASIQTINSWQ